MKLTASLLSILGVASIAGAQSYNSFQNVGSLYGVSFKQSGKTLTAKIDSGAYITVGGTNYSIVNAFGLFALDANGKFGSSFNGGTQNTNWSYNSSDASNKGIAGWTDDSKAGTLLTPGSSLSFTYTAADFTKVTGYGLHVTLPSAVSQLSGGGPTYFVTGNAAPVPEPVSMAALGMGVIGLIARRRRSI